MVLYSLLIFIFCFLSKPKNSAKARGKWVRWIGNFEVWMEAENDNFTPLTMFYVLPQMVTPRVMKKKKVSDCVGRSMNPTKRKIDLIPFL